MQVIFITIFGDRGLPDGVHLAGAVVMSQHTGRVINHGVLRVRTIRTVREDCFNCLHAWYIGTWGWAVCAECVFRECRDGRVAGPDPRPHGRGPRSGASADPRETAWSVHCALWHI